MTKRELQYKYEWALQQIRELKCLLRRDRTETMNRIIAEAAALFGVQEIELVSPDREAPNVNEGRLAAVAVAREQRVPLRDVATAFGRKNNTLWRSKFRVRELCETDETFKQRVDTLRERIKKI